MLPGVLLAHQADGDLRGVFVLRLDHRAQTHQQVVLHVEQGLLLQGLVDLTQDGDHRVGSELAEVDLAQVLRTVDIQVKQLVDLRGFGRHTLQGFPIPGQGVGLALALEGGGALVFGGLDGAPEGGPILAVDLRQRRLEIIVHEIFQIQILGQLDFRQLGEGGGVPLLCQILQRQGEDLVLVQEHRGTRLELLLVQIELDGDLRAVGVDGAVCRKDLRVPVGVRMEVVAGFIGIGSASAVVEAHLILRLIIHVHRFAAFHGLHVLRDLMQIGERLGVALEGGEAVPGRPEQLVASQAAAVQEPDTAADEGRQDQAAEADENALLAGALLRFHGHGGGLLIGLLLVGLLIILLLGLLVGLLLGLLPGLLVILLLGLLVLLPIGFGVWLPDGLGSRRGLLDGRGLSGRGRGQDASAVGAELGLIGHLAAAVGTEHVVSSFLIENGMW